jgi:hypothetical protein
LLAFEVIAGKASLAGGPKMARFAN